MSDDANLSIASAHYHAGRFGRAAAIFAGGQKNEHLGFPTATATATATQCKKRRLNPTTTTAAAAIADDIFGALPSLSVEADAALSAVRSKLAAAKNVRSSSNGSSSSNNNNNNKSAAAADISHLTRSALDANAAYRKALISASLSLRRREIGASNRNGRGGSDTTLVTNPSRRQLAQAFLMAGTSASWLHLADCDLTAGEEILATCLMGAASCFWLDEGAEAEEGQGGGAKEVTSIGTKDVLPPSLLPMTAAEAMHLTRRGLLLPTAAYEEIGGHPSARSVGGEAEMERCDHALRAFVQAVRVVQLGGGGDVLSGSVVLDTLEEKVSMNESSNGGEVSKEQVAKRRHDMSGSVGLRSQELLTRALLRRIRRPDDSQSSLSRKDESDACCVDTKSPDELLNQAATLESTSGHSSMGLARKMKSLLDGLRLLSGSKNEEATISTCLASLKALSSTSRTANAILGYLQAASGEHALAVEFWQRAVKIDEQRGDVGSSRYRETLLALANSFVLLGDSKPANELLLYLITDASATATSSNDTRGATLQVTIDSDVHSREHATERNVLLWQLFHISTLAEDWNTCLAAAEEMGRNLNEHFAVHEDAVRAARIFALLQCYQSAHALEQCIGGKNNALNGPLGALFDLFEAEALLTTKGSLSKSKSAARSITEQMIEMIESAANRLDTSSGNCNNGGDANHCGEHEIDAAIENNLGISLLMTGKVKDAFDAFEDASTSRRSTETIEDMSWLLLRPRFNLALLLWREGHKSEAMKVWMGTRKLCPDQGNNVSLYAKTLRATLEKAITQHALYCAKKKSSGDNQGNVLVSQWRQSGQSHCTSTSDEHIAGLDMEQVHAFDIIILQHAVAEADRAKRVSLA